MVGLGALPLTILDQNQEHVLNQVKFLKPHTLFNLDATKEAERDFSEHAIAYSCGESDA